ncbi:hypothetical protein GUJ93_ZPchr0006g43431 [Zizania palustris]|uniref:Uncharacterized protein n=1 Tax=Zizania palustris TaxID=103762 RepID=A0A8J5S6M4_ZIZPA|nr:hypothetical protein GUJ93_ZPchr0006g43431 [Zizania palustris]
MTGKGQRRREKNYRAAHGGDSRLPLPPKQRELDALPSKLRRLIALQEKQNGGAKSSACSIAGDSSGGTPWNQGDSRATKNKSRKDTKTENQKLKPTTDSKVAEISDKNGSIADETVSVDGSKGKGKLKRGKVMDLRFKELDETVSVSRKQKRKKYLDEKKKKRKGNKMETLPDFPGCEKVKFGEVVEAPPKLSFPKVPSVLHIPNSSTQISFM